MLYRAMVFVLLLVPAAVFAEDASVRQLDVSLARFETSMKDLALSGSDTEKASAIEALSLVASSSYPEVRNLLMKNESTIVRRSILHAISNMGDTSFQAKEFISTCLKANSYFLVSEALDSLFGEIEFRSIWDPRKALFLWTDYSQEDDLATRLTLQGVGSARPWNDPSWNELSPDVQVELLAVAGTPEAVRELQQHKLENLPNAESPDAAFFRQLLKDPNPEIQAYAVRTLLSIRDPIMIQGISAKITSLIEKRTLLVNGDLPMVDGVSVYLLLPVLPTKVVRNLVLTDLGLDDSHMWQMFSTVTDELLKRGEAFTTDELSPTNFPHVTLRTLRFQRFKSAARRHSSIELTSILKDLLEDPSMITPIDAWLQKDPEFLANFPDDLAHECYMALIAKRQIPGIPRLLGLFARNQDAEALWKQWKAAPHPADSAVFDPVLWGFNRRSRELRKILGTPEWDEDHQWSVLSSNFTCRRSAFPAASPALPVFPERVGSAVSVFLQDVKTIYPGDDVRVFEDFLSLRGITTSNADVDAMLFQLTDPRLAVRNAIWETIRLKAPFIPWNAFYQNFVQYPGQIPDWLELYKGERKLVRNAAWDWPGPPLTPNDQKFIEKFRAEIVQPAVQKYIENIGRFEFQSPSNSSDSYSQGLDASQFLESLNVNDLKSLVFSSDKNVRAAALWGLWYSGEHAMATKILMKDKDSKDPDDRLRALYLLQKIRYLPAKETLIALLDSPDPRMRWLALKAVVSFGLQDQYAKILQLSKDSDLQVANQAVFAMGAIHTVEARNTLVQLLKDDSIAADWADSVLAMFRAKQDIDAYAEALSDPNLDTVQRQRLYWIATKLTYRTNNMDDPYPSELDHAIREWVSWWKATGRDLPKSEWIRTMLLESVNAILMDPESENAEYANRALYPFLGGILTGSQLSDSSKRQLILLAKQLDSETLWDVITSPTFNGAGYLSPDILNLLYDISPERMAPWLYEQRCWSSYTRDIQEWIAQRTGMYLRSPCKVSCDQRDEVVSEWILALSRFEAHP